MDSMEFVTREGVAAILFRPAVPERYQSALHLLQERQYGTLQELSDVLYTATAGWGIQCQLLRRPSAVSSGNR